MNVLDLQQFVANQQAMDQQNSGFSQLGQMLGAEMKRRDDEKRTQANLISEMSTMQKLQQTMSSMPDQSSVGKAGVISGDNSVGKKGIVSVSPYQIKQGFEFKDGHIRPSFSLESTTQKDQIDALTLQKNQQDAMAKQSYDQAFPLWINGQMDDKSFSSVASRAGITDMKSLFDVKNSVGSVPTPVVGGQPIASSVQQAAIPEGYRPVYKQNMAGAMVQSGLEPIPSTDIKAQQDMATTAKAEQDKVIRAKSNAENALSSINEIRNSMGYFGRLDANFPVTPGTEKVAWSKNLDRVKAMLTLDNLMELKNASKNGASGLGALSDGERKMLEDAASALDRGLPKEKAAEYLNNIEKTLTRVLGGQGQSAQPTMQAGGQQKIGRFIVEAQ